MQFVPGYQNLDSNMFGDISPPPPRHSNLPSSSWLHVPPMQMPWGTPLADQPNIVRFTADSTLSAAAAAAAVPGPSTSFGFGSAHLGAFQTDAFNTINLQCKRRIDGEDEIRSPKKHITEEKMAAHMSMLSISGDRPHTAQQMSAELSAEEEPTSSLDQDSRSGKRVILSKELRAMQKEPIIPQSLISKEKPSMALVLWQPPSGFLAEHLRAAARLNSSNNTDERRNQQQHQQQQQLDSADNNNTPAAVDLNAFTTLQGDTIRDVEMEM